MNSHICILFCYNNVDHIKKCFESLKLQNIDFFIIENPSINSNEIYEYFHKQNLIGYIQFDTNITFKAIERFIIDYHDLLLKYEYITISDCDLQVENSNEVFLELRKNLSLPDVGVSCVDLLLDNFPKHVPGCNSWMPSPISETDEYIECATGGHLCTIKTENIALFQGTFIDQHIWNRTYQSNLKWVKTKKNKALHLTWDLYYEGNAYYELKKHNNNIWNHSNTSNYKKLI
jgi:hypothetical protein